MVLTVSSALSLVTGLFCHHRPQDHRLTSLTSASGCQDHTASPSALCAIRQKRQSVHRIPPYVFDDRETPLEKDGTATQYYCFYPAVKNNFGKSENR